MAGFFVPPLGRRRVQRVGRQEATQPLAKGAELHRFALHAALYGRFDGRTLEAPYTIISCCKYHGRGHQQQISQASSRARLGLDPSISGPKFGLILQIVVFLVAAASVWLVWHRDHTLSTRAMVLCSATLLATPYLFDYDLALLAVAIALVARRGMQDGFRPWEKSLLAALWVLPLIARPVSIYHLPLTPILLGLSLAFFTTVGASSQTVAVRQSA